MFNMSIKEKSTWLSLVATLYVFGSYAVSVFNIDLNTLTQTQAIQAAMQHLSSAVLLIIIVEII